MKKTYKVVGVSCWGIFYVLGLMFAPFVTPNPRTMLSCILFFISCLSLVLLNIWEYKSSEQNSPFYKFIMKYWMAYLANISAYIRIFIVSFPYHRPL